MRKKQEKIRSIFYEVVLEYSWNDLNYLGNCLFLDGQPDYRIAKFH